jgi:AraC family transcriptional regulator of adaptative response/methylated-DNA-[protein]-cysteine methyltransferase
MAQAPVDPLPLLPLPSAADMTRAYLASDASYDGIFLLAVRTTGVFCRPSCPARKPKPENVEFFARPKEALDAGYRPCRRCRPLDDEQAPEWVKALVGRVERDPAARVRERDLRASGLEPARVRRYFATRYGLTFQAYCRARRLTRAFEQIRAGAAIDDTVYETGYESHSGFRDAFEKTFGRPPGQSAGASCVHLGWLETPLGPMVAGATDAGLCLLEYTDRRMLERQLADLRSRFDAALVPSRHPLVDQAGRELDEYFAGTRTTFTVPTAARGTPFEARVWAELAAIPYGETRSYEDVARALGNAAAVRAVGRANGRNPIAVIVPCHRVVNKNGELGGYGGGLWRKRRLLHLEQSRARH